MFSWSQKWAEGILVDQHVPISTLIALLNSLLLIFPLSLITKVLYKILKWLFKAFTGNGLACNTCPVSIVRGPHVNNTMLCHQQ